MHRSEQAISDGLGAKNANDSAQPQQIAQERLITTESCEMEFPQDSVGSKHERQQPVLLYNEQDDEEDNEGRES